MKIRRLPSALLTAAIATSVAITPVSAAIPLPPAVSDALGSAAQGSQDWATGGSSLGPAQPYYDAIDGSVAGLVNNNPELINTVPGSSLTGLSVFWSLFSKLLGQRCSLAPQIPLRC